MTLSRVVARHLGHYVYLLVDPRDGRVFYIGKGQGQRALQHLDDTSASEKARWVRQIRARGQEPRIEILSHGLPDAKSALRVESAAIDLIGVTHLTNEVRGWRSGYTGRMPLEDLIATYEKRKIDIREPALLIRINRLYRYGMSDVELYDATRGVWRLGLRRERAQLAMAVFEGVVREVYAISSWLPAGSTFSTRDPRGVTDSARWELVGVLADETVRRRYLKGYVGHYFKPGAQNPVTYVNIA